MTLKLSRVVVKTILLHSAPTPYPQIAGFSTYDPVGMPFEYPFQPYTWRTWELCYIYPSQHCLDQRVWNSSDIELTMPYYYDSLNNARSWKLNYIHLSHIGWLVISKPQLHYKLSRFPHLAIFYWADLKTCNNFFHQPFTLWSVWPMMLLGKSTLILLFTHSVTLC